MKMQFMIRSNFHPSGAPLNFVLDIAELDKSSPRSLRFPITCPCPVPPELLLKRAPALFSQK